MPLEGKLGYYDIADLLRVVDVRQKSGVLRIRWDERSAKLFFNRGELIRAESAQFSTRLGDILVDRGILGRAEVERAFAIQSGEGGRRRIGAVLCDEFDVCDDEVQEALTAQFKAIVFDVLSWPEGSFEFDFTIPAPIPERYGQSASDFILRVGIEAGLLTRDAQKAVRYLILDDDGAFAATYMDVLHAQGVDIARVENPDDACTLAESGGRMPVLLLSVSSPQAAAVAAAVKKRFPAAPVLAYGRADAPWRSTELGSLADTFVVRPPGTSGEAFDVFLRLVQGAVSTLIEV